MPISVFNTYYMAGMIEEIVLPQSFFRDRYFPTNAGTDIFAADKVLVEYRDGDRKMAPFVVRRAGDIPIGRSGYEIHEFEPPYIAPSRLLTMDDLRKRGFGEALFSNSTPAERTRALQMQDLTDLSRRIQRREEWMAAQTMINNGCTAIAYIDNDTVGEPWDVFYYDVNGSNPAIYTVSSKWDAAGGDFKADVEAMTGDLLDRGLPATDLVVGTAVGQFIQSDEKLAKLLDNRRMEYGQLAPRLTSYPGIAWLGRLNFGGVDLDIYVVRETVVDEKSVTQRLFPATSAMVTAPDCGHMMYGQVTQIEDDGEFHTFAMQRVPKFTVDKEHDIRKLREAARPLAAPKQKAPWMYAANVVG
ncbi:major capsid protein [Anaeromassilibacillus senegalensis]|uniref:major capsid protein n=1 Tax=Anaeromassilibacillus senegalensis TaxID=1673717 RepID=UPI000680D1D3|nr:major capsid protein [Anaeromassilibacillus senegalensis]